MQVRSILTALLLSTLRPTVELTETNCRASRPMKCWVARDFNHTTLAPFVLRHHTTAATSRCVDQTSDPSAAPNSEPSPRTAGSHHAETNHLVQWTSRVATAPIQTSNSRQQTVVSLGVAAACCAIGIRQATFGNPYLSRLCSPPHTNS